MDALSAEDFNEEFRRSVNDLRVLGEVTAAGDEPCQRQKTIEAVQSPKVFVKSGHHIQCRSSRHGVSDVDGDVDSDSATVFEVSFYVGSLTGDKE